MKLKKGDNVMVITGKDKGKSGKIIEVDRATGKIVVEGVNIHHKFEKAQNNKAGGKISFPSMMNASKVMLIDPTNNKPSRVGYKFLESGVKQRISKSSGKAI